MPPDNTLTLSDFDYDLPPEQIAQTPIEPRDASRLLVVPRAGGPLEHRQFEDIGDYLRAGDVLVLNQTRVIPARLQAHKVPGGGAVELLLLRQQDPTTWLALVGGKRVLPGTQLSVQRGGADPLAAEVIDAREGAQRVVRFAEPLDAQLEELGEVPLPPYIHEPLGDPGRYQTIYARHDGSAAAPTAGLHFTGDLLLALHERGIEFAYCTLHIGLDTFQPVREENLSEHRMHSEWASLQARDAQIINEAKLAGRRVIAVGTTVVRTLESAAILSAGGDPASGELLPDGLCPWRPVMAFEQETRLFIRPGYRFRVVDGLVTNFHLPRSTLLMLVSAFMGREHTLDAYAAARDAGYRFYSFGDAMLIL
ncbi:MAG: tRNA preQ1(34) S-adenosylmethionine ribosyltransferase-isomerase QueA [Anaerolineae bacterium]|nr:tRNA preQ1(34) S-adenosylmethionine ribosyltransferase-isomerase QueA [Anaerolineae bacterium]